MNHVTCVLRSYAPYCDVLIIVKSTVTRTCTYRHVFIIVEDLWRQHFLTIICRCVDIHELAQFVILWVSDVDACVFDRFRLQHVQYVRLTSLDLFNSSCITNNVRYTVIHIMLYTVNYSEMSILQIS